jgi:DNA-binding SARP family transcriptional activator
LIDELWVGHPPDSARASLQNFVSELRRVLGASALLTCAAGYALDIQTEQTDAGRFRRIVADARAATATRVRARKLREALALWQGPALADISRTPSLEFEASLLNELRVSALEDALDAELELGWDAELVPELRRLIASEPYRERPRGQLMVALYRSGCQLQALEAFKEARETFRSEVGLEPSPRLCELQSAILNHDPHLAPRWPSRRTDDEEARAVVPLDSAKFSRTLICA